MANFTAAQLAALTRNDAHAAIDLFREVVQEVSSVVVKDDVIFAINALGERASARAIQQHVKWRFVSTRDIFLACEELERQGIIERRAEPVNIDGIDAELLYWSIAKEGDIR